MKSTQLYSILFVLLFIGTGVLSAQEDIQTTLPDVEIADVNGKKVRIKDFAENGKITVINFWATWCSPCKKELDNIADMYPEWQEAYGAELVAVSVDNSRTLPRVKPMVDAKGWEYIILSDKNNELRRAMNFQEVPFTFVIDKEGNIAYVHSGYTEGDEYELEDKIKALAEK